MGALSVASAAGRLMTTTGVDAGELTLAGGNVKLAFPQNTSGDSSFSWNNVDVDWTDGQTLEARLVRGEREATEATTRMVQHYGERLLARRSGAAQLAALQER